MARGDGRFPLLEHHDGLTDIVTIPCLAELDALHPGSRFVLTVRAKEDWLRSMQVHWWGKPVVMPGHEDTSAMQVRGLLRAAVFGCYEFNQERLARIYDDHVTRVRMYFRDRPDDLLVLDIVGGEGWEKLRTFPRACTAGRALPWRARPGRYGRAGSEVPAAVSSVREHFFVTVRGRVRTMAGRSGMSINLSQPASESKLIISKLSGRSRKYVRTS